MAQQQESNVDCNRINDSMDVNNINLDNYRKLVKSYIDLVSLFIYRIEFYIEL